MTRNVSELCDILVVHWPRKRRSTVVLTLVMMFLAKKENTRGLFLIFFGAGTHHNDHEMWLSDIFVCPWNDCFFQRGHKIIRWKCDNIFVEQFLAINQHSRLVSTHPVWFPHTNCLVSTHSVWFPHIVFGFHTSRLVFTIFLSSFVVWFDDIRH